MLVSSTNSFGAEYQEIERLPLLGDFRIASSVYANIAGITDEVVDIRRIASLEAEDMLKRLTPLLVVKKGGEGLLQALKKRDVAVITLNWSTGPAMTAIIWVESPENLTGPGALIDLTLHDGGDPLNNWGGVSKGNDSNSSA